MRLSKLANTIIPSATMAATLKAQELIAKGHDIVLATVGEPLDPVPEKVKQEAIRFLSSNNSKYGSAQGLLPFRKSIAQWMNQLYGQVWTESQIVVSPGSKYSLHALMQIICDPGDEVIIPAPYWVSYETLAVMAQAKPVIVNCPAEAKYKLTPELLRQNLNNKSRLLILNSPNNPTGAIYSKDELQALYKEIQKFPDLFVICDDIYNQLIFSDTMKRAPSILDVCSEEDRQRIVIVHGASKSFAMTGWRVGWTCSSPEVASKLNYFNSQTLTCIPDFVQKAAQVALESESQFVIDLKNAIHKKFQMAYQALADEKLLHVYASEGAFYLWMKFPSTKKSAVVADELLNQYGLSVVPGSSFGMEYHIRLSLTISEDSLKKAIDRLKKYLSDQNKLV